MAEFRPMCPLCHHRHFGPDHIWTDEPAKEPSKTAKPAPLAAVVVHSKLVVVHGDDMVVHAPLAGGTRSADRHKQTPERRAYLTAKAREYRARRARSPL